MTKYILCKIVNGEEVPLRNEHGFVSIFNDELDANIERIYLQPDYDELLKVIETKLDGRIKK